MKALKISVLVFGIALFSGAAVFAVVDSKINTEISANDDGKKSCCKKSDKKCCKKESKKCCKDGESKKDKA